MLELRAWQRMKYEAHLRARAGVGDDPTANRLPGGDEDAWLELQALWQAKTERRRLREEQEG